MREPGKRVAPAQVGDPAGPLRFLVSTSIPSTFRRSATTSPTKMMFHVKPDVSRETEIPAGVVSRETPPGGGGGPGAIRAGGKLSVTVTKCHRVDGWAVAAKDPHSRTNSVRDPKSQGKQQLRAKLGSKERQTADFHAVSAAQNRSSQSRRGFPDAAHAVSGGRCRCRQDAAFRVTPSGREGRLARIAATTVAPARENRSARESRVAHISSRRTRGGGPLEWGRGAVSRET